MKSEIQAAFHLVLAVCALGCGSRTTTTAGEQEQTLTGYLYTPLSSICMTQAADPSLPDYGAAALDTVVSSRSGLVEDSLDPLCGAGSEESPVTSFDLLSDLSNFRCELNRPPTGGCQEGHLLYRISGRYEQTEVCSLGGTKTGGSTTCKTGRVFVPTSVEVLTARTPTLPKE